MAVNDDVTVRAHVPKNLNEPSPALLWIHGGGYVMGTARQDDLFCRKVMRETGLPVVSVDYRLAPEHPYPTPIEDCYAALRWLSVQGWMAPAWLGIGTADLFHDEDLTYAERLRAAGVPCELEVVEGAFHGFDRFAPWAKVSKDFVAKACRSLRQALV